jgi:hypothetical protein
MTFKEKLETNQFVLCGEIGPPQSCDDEVIRRKSKYFKGFVDAVVEHRFSENTVGRRR